ncbi:MAG: hypothetical protein ACQCN6_02425 [Candidatus Bathyarchaeia archaeon]|jgi:hypothetical protein
MRYGRGNGNWPGNGPFSHLPPWQRPGYLYGRGACYYLYGAPNTALPKLQPEDETALLTQQKTQLETQLNSMQETLKKIQDRLDELKK